MLVVAALGGNALLRRGEAIDAATQRRNVAAAAGALAGIAAAHRLVVTHGNGPQVGLLALQSEAYGAVAPYPLDLLGAESEGMIGYLIDQELQNLLPARQVATLLTQVEVAPDDPAVEQPDKPIGPVYDDATAERLGRERGWTMIADGDGFRRAVPSPQPRRIVELTTIRLLLDADVLVVCCGGGGIPVVATADGGRRGFEAVVDKDATSALLAAELGADVLLLLTDVAGVWTDWRTPTARLLRRAGPAALRELSFAPGSMAPKVAAACRFVERTGGRAVIGALADAADMLDGAAGTQILPDQALGWDEPSG